MSGGQIFYVGIDGKRVALGEVQDFTVHVRSEDEMKAKREELKNRRSELEAMEEEETMDEKSEKYMPEYTEIKEISGTCSVDLSEKYDLFSMGKKIRFDKQDRKSLERLLKKNRR